VTDNCVAHGCERIAVTKGVCLMHYKRMRDHGHYGPRTADRGTRKSHPLYQRWRAFQRKAGREAFGDWNDFWRFVEDIGPRPSPNHWLRRKDAGAPIPGNLHWAEKTGFDFGTPDGKRAYLANLRTTNPRAGRDSYLQQAYGITIEQYDEMFQAQNGVCAICENPEWIINNKTGDVRALSVDHDHVTGQVRGLLCTNCNKMIGHSHDNQRILARGIDYLRAASKSLKEYI